MAKALKVIREFAPHWRPRYILCDQSSIKINSISEAFPGIAQGMQNCDIILCTVHVMRTWLLRVYHPATRNQLVAAMHKRTRIGCEEMIRNAIASCPVSEVARYIKRNYSKNTEKWALWARQHSPLLLQVTSTNPLESYHSELKKTTVKEYGLIGEGRFYFIIFFFLL